MRLRRGGIDAIRHGLMAMAMVCLALPAWGADAIDGTDPGDGRAVTGLRVAGKGPAGDAFLYLLCKTGRRNPEIWLSLPVTLGQPRDRIELNYTIDDGPERAAWFLIGENSRIGRFYILHNSLYIDRFGAPPATIDPATGGTSPQYEAWIATVFEGVIADLTTGTDAVFAAKEAGGPYRFPIKEVGALEKRIAGCRKPQ